jgi:L-lactate utilization protein LutC
MDANIEALAGSLKDLLRGRLDVFLSTRKDQKDFLEERARRLAELTVQLARAFNDPSTQARIRSQMDVVSDTIVNELHAAAIDISVEFRETVKSVLGTTIDYAIKVLPKLIPALATL